MTPVARLLIAWSWDSTVIAGCAGLVVAYLWALRASSVPGEVCTDNGPASPWRPISFLTAVVILFLALLSPLDTLADTYLFSAHMVQHLLLIVVVPPLMLLGLPARAIHALLGWAPAAACERALGRPALAWGLGVLTVWLWHLPRLYDAAVASEGIHVVEHLTFLVAAAIFWWPIVAPEPYRLPTWPAIGYLALGGFANTVLAIVITFAPSGLYPVYERPVDRLGILPMLRNQWGLTPGADQQLGGVLMWIPGGWPYLLAAIAALLRWYGEADEAPRQEASAREVAT